jgi:hypothetical protein
MRGMPYISTVWRPVAALIVVCVFPVQAYAQNPPDLKAPTIVASAAAAADWATTYYALKNYHVRELNPLLQPWQSKPGQLVSVGAIVDGAAFSTWNLTMGRKHPRIAAAGLWAMAGFRTFLAIHNIRNTQRAARR